MHTHAHTKSVRAYHDGCKAFDRRGALDAFVGP